MKQLLFSIIIMFIAVPAYSQTMDCESTFDTLFVVNFNIDDNISSRKIIKQTKVCSTFDLLRDENIIRTRVYYHLDRLFTCRQFDTAQTVSLDVPGYTITTVSISYVCSGCPDEVALSHSNHLIDRQLTLLKCNSIDRIFLEFTANSNTTKASHQYGFRLR